MCSGSPIGSQPIDRCPGGVRAWLFALLVSLILPIDLVPDFVPVIGYLDDALIVAVLLRFATRHAGAQALE